MSSSAKSTSIEASPTRRDLANAVRALAMDAVQAANSGHPGMPMGMADIAEVLFNDYLKHNPGNPRWIDRDRFVLSNGHGSMLLYSALHLSGYPLSLDDLRAFRQLGAVTAGHPEYEPGIGIETTTGPLGQGLANAVGMALAERRLAAEFNRDGMAVIDHRTWVFLGDGCLMEGISHEACSLAGTQKLGKLICFYDDNGISIDGEVSGWFTDDTPKRFESYGWHVIADVDGHDPDSLRAAIDAAIADAERPTLICCKTVIGYGSPAKAGTAASHGSPLGDDEIDATRDAIGWPYPPFEIPDAIYAAWDATESGRRREEQWDESFARFRDAYPGPAGELLRRMSGELPDDWTEGADAAIQKMVASAESPATRKASLLALNELAPVLPELIGGSADLTGSNCTLHATSEVATAATPAGNYLYFGVREFAMSAIANGLALHGGLIPYTGTFLTFSDYARNALRMAALMKIRNIFVYTHDSIGLGEDGPTHQPVEHVASLRVMPNMVVWRPCDTVETAVAWRAAVERNDGPTCLVLTRQGLRFQPRSGEQIANIRRGGYVLFDVDGAPQLVLIATGSEVALALDAARELAESGHSTRVVSMPSVEAFLDQPAAYRRKVLPLEAPRRLAIEAGVTAIWRGIVGDRGRVIGMDSFGESAPAAELFDKYGFSTGNVVSVAREMLAEPD